MVVNAIIYTYATVRHLGWVAISHFSADALVAGTAQPHRLEQFLIGKRCPILGTVGAEDLAARATVVLPTAQPKLNLAGCAPRYRMVRYPQDAARDLLRRVRSRGRSAAVVNGFPGTVRCVFDNRIDHGGRVIVTERLVVAVVTGLLQ